MEVGREIASTIGLGLLEELGRRMVGEGRHGGHGGWQSSQEREGFVTHDGCGSIFRVRFVFVSANGREEMEVKKKIKMHNYGLYVDRIKREGEQKSYGSGKRQCNVGVCLHVLYRNESLRHDVDGGACSILPLGRRGQETKTTKTK